MKIKMPIWLDQNGEPLACVEKIKVMTENLHELTQAAQDAFEDALLMGCDEQQIRAFLVHIMQTLENPYK